MKFIQKETKDSTNEVQNIKFPDDPLKQINYKPFRMGGSNKSQINIELLLNSTGEQLKRQEFRKRQGPIRGGRQKQEIKIIDTHIKKRPKQRTIQVNNSLHLKPIASFRQQTASCNVAHMRLKEISHKIRSISSQQKIKPRHIKIGTMKRSEIATQTKIKMKPSIGVEGNSLKKVEKKKKELSQIGFKRNASEESIKITTVQLNPPQTRTIYQRIEPKFSLISQEEETSPHQQISTLFSKEDQKITPRYEQKHIKNVISQKYYNSNIIPNAKELGLSKAEINYFFQEKKKPFKF